MVAMGCMPCIGREMKTVTQRSWASLTNRGRLHDCGAPVDGERAMAVHIFSSSGDGGGDGGTRRGTATVATYCDSSNLVVFSSSR